MKTQTKIKRFIFLLLTGSIITIVSCQKEPMQKDDDSSIQNQTSSDFQSKQGSGKIDVCHLESNGSSHIINISINAWPSHQAHGDVRLDDQDGDGFYPNNACGRGPMGDCNDNDASVSPVSNLVIGQNYQGGKLAYILQLGDPGFDPCVPHGLIAAPDDLPRMQWGCWLTPISGADGSAIGTGNQNTIDIVSGCGNSGNAAAECANLVLNGYSDWYLPSLVELSKVYNNKAAIGGFSDQIPWPGTDNVTGSFYWSSTEADSQFSMTVDFYNGGQPSYIKFAAWHVRAIRSF